MSDFGCTANTHKGTILRLQDNKLHTVSAEEAATHNTNIYTLCIPVYIAEDTKSYICCAGTALYIYDGTSSNDPRKILDAYLDTLEVWVSEGDGRIELPSISRPKTDITTAMLHSIIDKHSGFTYFPPCTPKPSVQTDVFTFKYADADGFVFMHITDDINRPLSPKYPKHMVFARSQMHAALCANAFNYMMDSHQLRQ